MAVWKPKTEVLEETKFADTWWWTFRVQELEKINFHCSTHPVCGILSGQPYNTNICIVRSECSARKTGAKSFHRESARDPLKGEDVFTRNTWGRAFLKEKHANTSCLSICSYSTPVHYWSIYYKVNIGRISSVQSVMSDSLHPHGLYHARLPCPSPIPRACSNSCPSSWWCLPTISSSVVPFSFCLQSFPA